MVPTHPEKNQSGMFLHKYVDTKPSKRHVGQNTGNVGESVTTSTTFHDVSPTFRRQVQLSFAVQLLSQGNDEKSTRAGPWATTKASLK